MKRILSILFIALFAVAFIASGCKNTGSAAECEMDGDCPLNWRCDAYAKICRCVKDEGCNLAANERCMPDGTCQIYTGCASDSDCGSCRRCEAATGECLCTDDCACGDNEICNASGFCQPKTGCFDNSDCAVTEICDTPSKQCIPATTCTTKFQCPLGQVCTAGSCVNGCDDHGDCPFRWACINNSCDPSTCPDDSFCQFMEYCNAGTCTDAYNEQYAPYCKTCNNVLQDPCGDPANLCLIYPFENDGYPSDNYCGVDCSGGQRCPVGFECSTVILVAGSCYTDAECPGILPCLRGEEDRGFCPCNNNSNPCTVNSCTWGFCAASGRSCNTTADCRDVYCEYYEGYDFGGCVFAKNCGLKEGFHCNQ